MFAFILLRVCVALVVLVSAPVYVGVVWIIVTHKKASFVSSFFTVFLSLAASDLLRWLLYTVGYMLPLWDVFSSVYVSAPWIGRICITGTNMAETTSNLGTMLISLNRAAATAMPSRYATIWSPKMTKWAIVIQWIIGPLSSIYLVPVSIKYTTVPLDYGSNFTYLSVVMGDGHLFGVNGTFGFSLPQVHFTMRAALRVLALVVYGVCYAVIFFVIITSQRRVRNHIGTTTNRRSRDSGSAPRRSPLVNNSNTPRTSMASQSRRRSTVTNGPTFKLAVSAFVMALSDVSMTVLSALVALFWSWWLVGDADLSGDLKRFRHFAVLEAFFFTNIFVSPYALVLTSSALRARLKTTALTAVGWLQRRRRATDNGGRGAGGGRAMARRPSAVVGLLDGGGGALAVEEVNNNDSRRGQRLTAL